MLWLVGGFFRRCLGLRRHVGRAVFVARHEGGHRLGAEAHLGLEHAKRLHHAIILNIIINFLVNHPKMEYCDCSLIPESLEQWNKTLQDFGGERYKVFRLYDRAV